MLNLFLLFIAGSVVVLGMSIDTPLTALDCCLNFNPVDITERYSSLIALLDLTTGVPATNYNLSNFRELINLIETANYVFELGYTHVNGVLVYAIKIGNIVYSVEPHIFRSLIFGLF